MNSLLNFESSAREFSGEWKVFAPFNKGMPVETGYYRYSDLEPAIQAATLEKAKLAALSFEDRIKILKESFELFRTNRKLLADTVALELGRTPDDFENEWNQTERLWEVLIGIRAFDENVFESRGITAIVGSSIWPLFYSIQFCAYSLLSGNPVILKPSEKATLSVLRLFELFRSQIPAWRAVQVLIGEKEVGRRLICHEQVNTVVFQGSFEVGMRVKQDTLSQAGKEILLYLGAKNPAVIFDDASKKEAMDVLLKDSFLGAGQDCQSVSIAFIQNGILNEFVNELHLEMKKFKIGPPESGAFMGPMMDASTADRYLKFIGISEREGANILMRGKPLPLNPPGCFVTPTLALFEKRTPEEIRKSVSLQTEILAPHLSVIGFQDEEELLSLLQPLTYGRSISLWSANPKRLSRLAMKLPFGQVLWNRSLLGSDPKETFQFRKRSGNNAVLGESLLFKFLHQRTIQK